MLELISGVASQRSSQRIGRGGLFTVSILRPLLRRSNLWDGLGPSPARSCELRCLPRIGNSLPAQQAIWTGLCDEHRASGEDGPTFIQTLITTVQRFGPERGIEIGLLTSDNSRGESVTCCGFRHGGRILVIGASSLSARPRVAVPFLATGTMLARIGKDSSSLIRRSKAWETHLV